MSGALPAPAGPLNTSRAPSPDQDTPFILQDADDDLFQGMRDHNDASSHDRARDDSGDSSAEDTKSTKCPMCAYVWPASHD